MSFLIFILYGNVSSTSLMSDKRAIIILNSGLSRHKDRFNVGLGRDCNGLTDLPQ